MISPAFFVASMVGFHVEFSQSMYSSKCPYSTCASSTSVTGPSVYWRSSWARAFSESEEATRHVDKIIVLIIFSSPVVKYLYSADTPGRTPAQILFFDCTIQSSQVFAKSYGWVYGACAQVLRKPSLLT